MTRKTRTVILVVVGVVLIALASWGVYKIWMVSSHLRSALATIQQLESLASGSQEAGLGPQLVSEIQSDVLQLQGDLEAINRQLGPVLPAAQHLGWVPVYGRDIQAAPALLEFAEGIATAGSKVMEASDYLTAPLTQDDGTEDLGPIERFMDPLIAAQPMFAEAGIELDRASALRSDIDVSDLSPRLGGQLNRIDRYLPLFEQAITVAKFAPGLLGAEQARSYLIIAQNSHELRPTGGFVTGVGLLTLDGGRIEELTFEDSYTVFDVEQPHPDAPDSLLKYMKAEILVFRDANWWADFPTSAQALASMYELDTGVEVDGVIALDLTTVEWLVSALGPLSVSEDGPKITGKNVLQFMTHQWADPEGGKPSSKEEWWDWFRHRKDFMSLLLNAMMQKVQSPQDLDVAKLATTLKRSLDERHLLIYLDDPQASALLGQTLWDGALRSDEASFLMVVDSNVGFNKVNPRIDESITYHLDLSAPEAPRAQLTIDYVHTSTVEIEECDQSPRYDDVYEEMMDRCYFDYLRVYVPSGATLIESDGLMAGSFESYPGERNTQVFAGFFVLSPGEERQVRIAFRLPAVSPNSDSYGLVVQKQPGTKRIPFTLYHGVPAELLEATTLNIDRVFAVPLPPN